MRFSRLARDLSSSFFLSTTTRCLNKRLANAFASGLRFILFFMEHPSPPCEHLTLGFASGGLYVTCFQCGQYWIAMKPADSDGYRYSEPVIAVEAGEHGLTLADTRLAPKRI